MVMDEKRRMMRREIRRNRDIQDIVEKRLAFRRREMERKVKLQRHNAARVEMRSRMLSSVIQSLHNSLSPTHARGFSLRTTIDYDDDNTQRKKFHRTWETIYAQPHPRRQGKSNSGKRKTTRTKLSFEDMVKEVNHQMQKRTKGGAGASNRVHRSMNVINEENNDKEKENQFVHNTQERRSRSPPADVINDDVNTGAIDGDREVEIKMFAQDQQLRLAGYLDRLRQKNSSSRRKIRGIHLRASRKAQRTAERIRMRHNLNIDTRADPVTAARPRLPRRRSGARATDWSKLMAVMDRKQKEPMTVRQYVNLVRLGNNNSNNNSPVDRAVVVDKTNVSGSSSQPVSLLPPVDPLHAPEPLKPLHTMVRYSSEPVLRRKNITLDL